MKAATEGSGDDLEFLGAMELRSLINVKAIQRISRKLFFRAMGVKA